MSRCHDEAFQLARQHHQMELYGEILSSSLETEARPEDYRSLAVHFEGEHNSMLAGKYYYHAGDYSKVRSFHQS
jgi:WD repeat-containing protein 19